MAYRKIVFIIILMFFSFTHLRAQDNLLLRKVNLASGNSSLKYCLRDIGQSADFKFSYNTDIIKGDSSISYDFKNLTVEECLDKLLDESIRYKVSGNHIILLKTSDKNSKKQKFIITGTVVDSETKQKIQHVSIYDVDEKYSTITNSNGYYKLEIPSDREYRGLSYSKNGYSDNIIVTKTIQDTRIDVALDKAIIIKNPKFEKVEPIENRPLSNFLIPNDVIINSNNLQHVKETRFAQVSLLPSIGTNLSSYGVLENNFSLNILAGYSRAVKGVEIGSLVNIVKENVSGFQLAGLGNMIGGKLKGVQTSGLINLNTKSVKGLQLAGFANTALDTVTGIQLAGFTNILKGRMNGAQISGFYNMTTKDVDGIQLAGFANMSFQDIKLMQISGFTNIGQNVEGIQIAGFANISKGKVGGAQIAGFANFAGSVNFAQISGFMNIAYEDISGAQISSFLNLARDVRGFQLAFINISDTVSGLSVGFLSYVNKGFHQFEISGNETFYANLAFKTGTKHFYNIFSAGIDPREISGNTIKKWYGGYGFGTEITTKSRFFFGFDITLNQIFEDINYTQSFTSLLKLDLNLGLRLFKKSAVTIGPSFNYLISNRKDESGNYFSTIPPPYSQTQWQSTFLTSTWVGGRIAIRI